MVNFQDKKILQKLVLKINIKTLNKKIYYIINQYEDANIIKVTNNGFIFNFNDLKQETLQQINNVVELF